MTAVYRRGDLEMNPNNLKAENLFVVRLSNLDARIRTLEKGVDRRHPDELKKEANTCEAFLKRLHQYAIENLIDLSKYYSQLTDIKTRLLQVRNDIAKQKQPRWKKALNAIIRAINWVAILLSCGPLLPQLPAGDKQLFLPGDVD